MSAEIYNTTSNYNNVIDFARLDLTYFETPKVGSTSVKRYLFCANSGRELNERLRVGHKAWHETFPESKVADFSNYKLRSNALLVVRDPIKRIKSAYRNMFRGRMGRKAGFEEFMSSHIESFCASPADDFMANHFKPQNWFVPDSLLDYPGLIVCDTSQLLRLPLILRSRMEGQLPEVFPHSNESKLDVELSWTDDAIRDWSLSNRPEELEFYERASAKFADMGALI